MIGGDSPLESGFRSAEPGEFIPSDYFRRLRAKELFGDCRPFEVDLGCGDGSFLLAMAAEHPSRSILGVERLLGRVRKVCRQVQQRRLANVRVLRLEARYTVEWLLPPMAISRLHLLFPDPWPKARHHKRRLIQQPFLAALRDTLVPGGEFLFKTDHPEYYEWTVEQLEDFEALEIITWQEDDFFYPETDFETQWRAEGREVFRVRARRPTTDPSASS